MDKNRKIPVEVYSRTVGYYRPVNQWNKGKREEFNDRYFIDPHSINVRTGPCPRPEQEKQNV